MILRRNKKCRSCREAFLPDPRSYRPMKKGGHRSVQRFCSKPACRVQSDRQSHHACIHKDPDYRAVCQTSKRQWAKRHPEYPRHYRETHSAYVEENRKQQRRRDARKRGFLVKNNSIDSLQHEKTDRIRIFIHLAKNNSSRVDWTMVSEEIRLYLNWIWWLAKNNPIGKAPGGEPQSRS